MAERNASSIGLISQKSLFYLFSIASICFISSWLFVLRSTGRPQLLDNANTLFPNSKLHAMSENDNSESQNPIGNQPSVQIPSVIENKVETPQKDHNLIKCTTTSKQVLKIFMYDLPPEFHFELLGWKGEAGSVWPGIRTKIPEYPGGLNLQHSIAYWLTLDLLSSEFAENLGGRSAIRVHNSSEADVIFVPFFSSISYNRYSRLRPHGKSSRNVYLQEKLVKFLKTQKEWERSGGRDHIIVAHHPNSLLDARMKLWPAMFILSDFGRYPPNIANVEKDVIAPYKHVIRSFINDSSTYDSRPVLLYFQGAIYRKDGGFVRQELYYLLKDEKEVHFSFGSVQKGGITKATQGMHASKFCLNIAGDTPSSNRLFDAIASHCVPVIISDEIELPYEDVLDYSEFCVFVRASDAIKANFLINLVRGIGREEWTRMWKRLKEVEEFFEYRYPSREGDAVQMIWQAVARRVPALKMKLNKSKRYARTPLPPTERGAGTLLLPRNFS